jgi:hypothetical protein
MYVERNIHGRAWPRVTPGAFGPIFLLLISALCAVTGEGGAWPVCTGSTGNSGPYPCPGSRSDFLPAARERARWTNWHSVHSRRCAVVPSRPSDRPPGHPPNPKPGRWEFRRKRTPEVIAAARTSRQSLRLVSRRPQSRRCSAHPAACASLVARRGWGSACAKGPTALPHGAPIHR